MTDELPPDTATDEGITMTRIFDAPRDEVWKEWTEPERFADWYGGTEAEIPVESIEMDVRPGGAWKATMYYGGRAIHWHGAYREVSEPERLSLTVTDQDPAEEYDLVTVVLRDLGDDRTEMRFTQTGGHMPKAGYERAMEGWGGFFDRIAERLAHR
jgi:uncharacterized protein YndB with AHSA1/START domain